jgi:hypothetical protein
VQSDAVRGGRGERQCDERIERVVSTGFEPALITRRMIGHVDSGEAERLGVRGHAADRRTGEQLAGVLDL